jgi:hypothetical protein
MQLPVFLSHFYRQTVIDTQVSFSYTRKDATLSSKISRVARNDKKRELWHRIESEKGGSHILPCVCGGMNEQEK